MVDRGADSEGECGGGGAKAKGDLRDMVNSKLKSSMAGDCIPDPQENPAPGPSGTTCSSNEQSFRP